MDNKVSKDKHSRWTSAMSDEVVSKTVREDKEDDWSKK